jgi:hypothetical protein
VVFAYNNAHDAVLSSVFLAATSLFSVFAVAQGRRGRGGGREALQGRGDGDTRPKREREIQRLLAKGGRLEKQATVIRKMRGGE